MPGQPIDVAAMEFEMQETRARLARIIGAADASLHALRRRRRAARSIATAV